MQITNCHVHTFTHDHTPARFLPWPVPQLVAILWFRRAFVWLARRLDRGRRGRLERYAEILATSYNRTQAQVFAIVQGFYPEQTRFVVLPMDMTHMNAGPVRQSIDEQHTELARLRDQQPDSIIPFAAVDPRHGQAVVEKTIDLIEQHRFRGIKLYPPTGYHPNDPVLRPLYAWAEQQSVPVLTHCSRPASVQYRGKPTEQMRTDPVTGQHLNLSRFELLTRFTDPDAYLPILAAHPKLRLCLAHFGGAGDWNSYLKRPWLAPPDTPEKSWLAKILDLIRSGHYPNLWTDISFTVFADEEYVYLLNVLLSDERIRARTLFGSDYYVVADAKLEERRRAIRVRAVLGEQLFQTIAQDNPNTFLNG
jgi:predicted TIM-barrel fold metal-dependent hydrolase